MFTGLKKNWWEAAIFGALLVFVAAGGAVAADLRPLGGWDVPPAEKAAYFEWSLHRIHDIDGMILSDVRIVTEANGEYYETAAYDDSAYWTGNYMLGESLRYAVTKSPDARANAERSARALIRLTTASGKPGLPIRGYMDASRSDRFRLDETYLVQKSEDGSKFLSLDVSVDQLMGIMQGLHFAYRYVADDALKKEISEAVGAVLDHIIDNGYRIVDLDGKPTTFGHFEPGAAISHLHAFLALAIFKMGAWITGEERHEQAYQHLRVDAHYGEQSRYAKLLPLQNFSDDAMEFMGYINILPTEDDPAARADYLASLRRSWEVVQYHDKALFNLVALQYLDDIPDREEVKARTLDQLRNFPLVKTHWSADFFDYPRPDPKRPNPAQFRPPDGYYWTTNTFQSAAGKGGGTLMVSSGIDYIMAYWLARYMGILEN